MTEEICAKAIKPSLADLTLTKEYFVIKGKHYQVRNHYLYATDKAQAISIKDILSMEYLTIRSKRMFIVFMILMTIVVFGGVGIRKMFSATRQLDKEVQKIENTYNYVTDEEIDINITDTIKGPLSEIGIKGIVVIYAILIIGSVVCFLYYLLRPFRVLYISTLGMVIAVERKFYDKSQLDSIVNTWQMQLR